MLKPLLFSILVLVASVSFSQEVYTHVSNTGIYEFLDEMANMKVIQLNSSIKPYSRIFIANKLAEVDGLRSSLNKRQQGELDFYLQDYNKELKPDKNFKKRYDLFYYKDTLFTITVNPIFGYTYYTNDSGSFYHRRGGAELYGSVGKHFGFYASLRDNHESRRLSDPLYLNQAEASNYKVNGKGGDFDEARGGLSYSWNWGSVSVVKDNMVWGDNYNGSNIFSGRQPSYTSIRFRMKPVEWFEFNYMHGWLVSDVLDSSRSYYSGQFIRRVMRPKYVAANMFSVRPFKGLWVSLGNSIIYSDQSVNPAYLVPFFFYKSVDHTLTSTGSNWLGQNSQLYFNISSRNIKNVHLYTSVFVDEFSVSRALDADQQTNFVSVKAGGTVSNILNKNISATVEFTRSNPGAYRHYIPTCTFTSSDFNMGHYLRDNAREIYLSVSARPIPKLFLEASYTLAQKGTEYVITGSSRDTVNNGKGLPFLDKVRWEMSTINLTARYQIVNDLYVFGGLMMTKNSGEEALIEQWTMPYYWGDRTTIRFGFNAGF